MNPKIMIADDDPRLLGLYEATLKSQGYRVATATNGEEVLARIKDENPDLLLMDIMMPKLHGINALDIIKATPDTMETKVIVITAISDDKTREQALELGAIDYIVKAESNMADILERVNKALR